MDDKYYIKKLACKDAKDYIRRNHYSKTSHNGPSPCYGLFDILTEDLVGCLMFATPCSENVRRWFDGNVASTIELHRLHIQDTTPKNTESWFISKCLKCL